MNQNLSQDYYIENGLYVFTESYHLKRGYCCESGCRHCPYGFNKSKKKKVSISWSGGKDSAFALYKILQSGNYEIVNLHTVFGEDTKRVGLHGVPEELIEQQALALSLPLKKLYLKTSDDHYAYEELMSAFYKQSRDEDIEAIVFGDIFLEDLKKFRENILSKSKLLPVFPIWKFDSRTLIRDFLDAGFKTLICSADADYFKPLHVGRTIDHTLLKSFPKSIDPCGENGEFHTFVYDGPIFKTKVRFDLGAIIERNYTFKRTNDDGTTSLVKSRFWFQDLVPLSNSQ